VWRSRVKGTYRVNEVTEIWPFTKDVAKKLLRKGGIEGIKESY
jgi:hypothetical protein